jgi:hypothetical protein
MAESAAERRSSEVVLKIKHQRIVAKGHELHDDDDWEIFPRTKVLTDLTPRVGGRFALIGFSVRVPDVQERQSNPPRFVNIEGPIR